MGKPAVTIELTNEQRGELESLVRRRQTAQGLARRAEIVLLAAKAFRTRRSSRGLAKMPTPWVSGVAASRSRVLMAFMTSPDLARLAKSAMTTLLRRSERPLKRCWLMRPTGHCAAWPKPRAMRLQPSIGSGGPSVCNRIAARRSSFPPTPAGLTTVAFSRREGAGHYRALSRSARACLGVVRR